MPLPVDMPFPYGVIVFLRQSLRSEQGSWTEMSHSLHCYAVPREGQAVALNDGKRAVLLRGLFQAVVRNKPEDDRLLIERILAEENALSAPLRSLTPEDAERRVRHAVMPLFAGVISAQA
jgi:hypothetical protein